MHLLGFVSVGKVLRKAERIVGLDKRKCNKVFIGISAQHYMLFAFFQVFPRFSPFFFPTESCSFGHG